MPLSAIVNGKLTLATALGTDEWLALRASHPVIRIPCCDAEGHMRTSERGIRHFYHAAKKGSCPGGGESPLHLELKNRIVEAALKCGWHARTEVADATRGWRADVLIWKDNVRIAFDVQLSRIKYEELKRRQNNYSESKVRGCWLMGPEPGMHQGWTNQDEPFFAINEAGNVLIGRTLVPIETAVTELLAGHYKRVPLGECERKTVLKIFHLSCCPECEREFDVCFLAVSEKSRCFEKNDLGLNPFSGEELQELVGRLASGPTKEKVRQIVANWNPGILSQSFLGWQRSSSWPREWDLACYHCGELIHQEIWSYLAGFDYWKYTPTLTLTPVSELEIGSEIFFPETPHWCHSKTKSFCRQCL